VQKDHLNAHRLVNALELTETGNGPAAHQEDACPVFAAREQLRGPGGDGMVGCAAVARLGQLEEDGLDRLVQALIKRAAQGVVVLKRARDTPSVAAPGRCRQQQRASGVEVVKHRPPRLGRSVVRLIHDDQVEEVARGKLVLHVVSRTDRVWESDDHIVRLEHRPVGGASRKLDDARRTNRRLKHSKPVELRVRRELLHKLRAQVPSRREDQDPARRINTEERGSQPDGRLASAGRDADDRRLPIRQSPVRHRRAQRADLRPAPTPLPSAKERDLLRGSPVEARLCHLPLRAGTSSLPMS
jgi:hypothetical protein